MNISPCEHKSGQMLQAVTQSLTWMPETFYARFPVRSILYSERCAHICLAPSQNSNVWQPNIPVWTHFEPIFSLRVHGWIQTTVSVQLAGVRGCRRKRQLSFLYNVFILMYRRPQLAIFGTAFFGELPQAWTVLLFGSYSGQIFPRSNTKFARHIACCAWSEVKWITSQV